MKVHTVFLFVRLEAVHLELIRLS